MIKGIIIAGAGSLFSLFCSFVVYSAYAEWLAAVYSTYKVKPYGRIDIFLEIADESVPGSILVFGTPFFILAYFFIAYRAMFQQQTTKRSFQLFFLIVGFQVTVCVWGYVWHLVLLN